ncbi:hypothetical protein KSF_070490 [Reticulibacter mediterranei]|uniref:Uncharacterized protein n=1 Tax=Reticulibacter mediterranei TaxID=2778369 RepID=A0A8J3IM07_9CHLR|nr:hypothetical protein [Reticulibacter mediterranei]GHO97001.1 hypothetical protein KSF_070490 [Reticulibacter mediterranei]
MDKTFKQTIEELHGRIARNIEQAAMERIDRLTEGSTVAEATADISNESLRAAVMDILLYSHLCARLRALTPGTLTREQGNELLSYVRERIVPYTPYPKNRLPHQLD